MLLDWKICLCGCGKFDALQVSYWDCSVSVCLIDMYFEEHLFSPFVFTLILATYRLAAKEYYWHLSLDVFTFSIVLGAFLVSWSVVKIIRPVFSDISSQCELLFIDFCVLVHERAPFGVILQFLKVPAIILKHRSLSALFLWAKTFFWAIFF